MYRILLVDDEILVRDAIKENIDWKSMDCELVGDCENGKQAAEFVQEHPVDIVLTDILMPYMDGMELSHFLHDNYPDVVIVVFSGFGEFEYAKKAIQYGVSEYLLKPVTAMELTGVIQKMKEKVDQIRKEKRKMESLTRTSENYRANAQIIRSKTLDTPRRSKTNLKKWESHFPAVDTAWQFLISTSIPACIRSIWRNARRVHSWHLSSLTSAMRS